MRLFRSCSLLALLALIAVPAWAIQLGGKTSPERKSCRPAARRLVVHWVNQVTYLPDPVRGGIPAPGLRGRVSLFGPESLLPIKADGNLMVELFNPAQHGPDGQPRLMEKWILNQEQLQKLERPGPVTGRYELFLPWGTYSRDIDQVLLRTVYLPKQGAPLVASSGAISLKRDVSSTPGSTAQKRDSILAPSTLACKLAARNRNPLRLVVMASLPLERMKAYPSRDRDLAYLLRKRLEQQLQGSPIRVEIVPVKQVDRLLTARKPPRKPPSPLDIGRRFSADYVIHLEARSMFNARHGQGGTQPRTTLGLLLTILDVHQPDEDPIHEEALTASIPTPDAEEGEEWLFVRQLLEEAARVAAARVAIQPTVP